MKLVRFVTPVTMARFAIWPTQIKEIQELDDQSTVIFWETKDTLPSIRTVVQGSYAAVLDKVEFAARWTTP